MKDYVAAAATALMIVLLFVLPARADLECKPKAEVVQIMRANGFGEPMEVTDPGSVARATHTYNMAEPVTNDVFDGFMLAPNARAGVIVVSFLRDGAVCGTSTFQPDGFKVWWAFVQGGRV